MARSLNKVMLIGHLGADPELRYTPSGVPVATFRIATNETWRDAEGKPQEKTEWHNIVVWRKLAELTNDLLKKGSRVYVEGRLQTRTYEDKNGIRRTVTEIVADDIILLESRTAANETAQQTQQRITPQEQFETDITDLPLEPPQEPNADKPLEDDELPF